MTITELTLLRLKPGATTSDSALRAKLLRVRDILEFALGSKRFVHWYQQTEDPSYLYIICEWTSAAEHRQQFIPSKSNKELMELLQDDFEPSKTKTLYVDISAWDIPVDAPLFSIGSHKVAAGDKEAFEKRFCETRYLMDEYVTRDRKGAGGWRIGEENEDKREWVLFVGWESWEQHFNFLKIEGFKEYSKILRLLDGYESAHAKTIDL